ncbi:uncharacterized protein (TIGR02453 family) [Flavobacterium endophyticum]|uniref:Uncharacterized protein (TIGR02453 family) n=1 Tax=Flavobacterium endophyticum TaxID=1540163 RepID=A0A495M9H2_9FLAO|nr:DUF2461 domain-containing protein [Flavobacterium endophyticum]RKS21945.1 uncharacterized protein (TIGR02453 family) [Flavobacterium endophyticum]
MDTKMPARIPASSFDYLKMLKENNDRDWFNENKDRYLKEYDSLEHFADALLQELRSHDVIETASGKKSLHRIYRDTRFSKDKTPYKTNWSGGYKRATALRRGGYYFHIEPGNSFIAGGFWAPNTEDIKRIREDISSDPDTLRKIIESKTFKATFGSLQGEQLKTTPKGFDAADSAIDLLRYKQFLLVKRFTDDEVLSPSFLKEADQTFKNMRPFFDYMSEVLTTDANGEPLYSS